MNAISAVTLVLCTVLGGCAAVPAVLLTGTMMADQPRGGASGAGPASAAPTETTEARRATMHQTGLHYPATRTQDLVETKFGTRDADPYRWLENDVREDAEVAEWVAEQNRVTGAYLATLPGREVFAQRLEALIDYERYGLPREANGRYVYEYNSGLQNQSVLVMRTQGEDAGETGRLVLDPNGWSADNTVALGEFEISPDGRFLAYTEQDGGSDWRTLKILDLDSGETLSDRIEWIKFSALSWDGDSQGVYYSRFAQPEKGDEFQSLNLDQQVYYHRLGEVQSDDRLIYETSAEPKLGHVAEVTDDGRYLVIYSREGTDAREDVHVVDLASGERNARAVVTDRQSSWILLGNRGESLFFMTNRDAPRQKIVRVDLQAQEPVFRDVVPEQDAVLEEAVLKDGVIVTNYLSDVKSELRTFDLSGNPSMRLTLPGIGTANLTVEGTDTELFYGFASFTVPTRIYRVDLTTGEQAVWAEPTLPFDPDAYEAEQVFYASKDGTRIPMFVVRKSGVGGSAPQPTLLYGYGGFNASVLPAFSATRLAWMEQGGVVAIANLRGGGEYGKVWHDAGRLENKQNVFDDFIAAGEYLIAEGITTPRQLAIQGGSNGGLLVGAVTNQRPDLFAAALPAVGVMDMLRFDQFTAGRYWVDDYGYPDREADFRTLRAYSPYHNIREGQDYPAILVTTADTDDRVVPGHSFKYTAAIQAADIGDRPHLIRIETRAGHGSGKPVDKVIEEYADVWAFAAEETGLKVKED